MHAYPKSGGRFPLLSLVPHFKFLDLFEKSDRGNASFKACLLPIFIGMAQEQAAFLKGSGRIYTPAILVYDYQKVQLCRASISREYLVKFNFAKNLPHDLEGKELLVEGTKPLNLRQEEDMGDLVKAMEGISRDYSKIYDLLESPPRGLTIEELIERSLSSDEVCMNLDINFNKLTGLIVRAHILRKNPRPFQILPSQSKTSRLVLHQSRPAQNS
jgi:hypothetical protein